MPFFDQHGIRLLRVLTDRGTEYCGNPQHHEYELYLALEDIDHTRTRAKSPQTNGIVERLHKTMLNEFYRIVFRKKIYDTIDALQTDSLNLISGRCVFKRPEPALCSGGTRLNTALPAPSFSPTVARSKHLAQILPHAAGRTGLVSTAQPGLTESPRLSAATWSHQL